jgi:hypothetical protein
MPRELGKPLDLFHQRTGRPHRRGADMRVFSGRETAKHAAPIDATGLALLAVGVGSLQIMLDTGADTGWFDRGGSVRCHRIGRSVLLHRLGADRCASRRGSALVPPSQLSGALFMVPLQSISLSGLRNDQMAAAAGLSSFVRVIGGSFGASLAITLWSRREALHRTQLSESISAWDPRDVESIVRIAERGARDQQTYSILERMLSSQSHLLGAVDFFWLTGWVLIGLVAIVWFARPPFGAAKMAPAE